MNRGCRLLSIVSLCVLPWLTHAQEATPDLAALNRVTLQAIQSGDLPIAVARARDSVEASRTMQDPDTAEVSYALNNLGYVLSFDPQTADEGLQWLNQAVDVAEPLRDIDPWALAMTNRINLLWSQSKLPEAEVDAKALLSRARLTLWHGRALVMASSVFFERGQIIEATNLFHELIATEPDLLQSNFSVVFETYAKAQNAAEAEGRVDEAVALLDARIALLRQYVPGQANEFSQTLLWQKFYQQYQADRFGDAADTLREMVQTGPLAPEYAEEVNGMATLWLEATQLSGYSERREVQLPYAELAVAFAELLGVPDDPRLGLALREVATAEENLGQLSEAALTLQRSLSVLMATPEGFNSAHLVLSDLAANARLRTDYDLAERFYAQADEAYQAALSAGAGPLSLMDEVIDLTSRAAFMNDLELYEDALVLLEMAWSKFHEDAARGEQKWNSKATAALIFMEQALAQSALGQAEDAVESVLASVAVAREVLPETHPDLSLTLANAADALFVEGKIDLGLPLLEEAVAINREALPKTMPRVAETQSKLAIANLYQGDQAAALALMRAVAEARKSPAYQDQLAEIGYEFEILAWLLLDRPGQKTADVIDEALSAIQWTQVTRSAQALAMMEARLAQNDPANSFWLRRRQDIQEAHARNFSHLLAAYADVDAEQSIAPLEARHRELELELASTEETLASLGLETTGVTGVNPLSVADIQALLKPDEAIVTFMLPGLIPDFFPGLEISSNHVIAITPDTFSVARIPEFSRGSLNERITAFRCQVSVSDPGCLNNPAAALRGAMFLDEEPDEAEFDFDSAYRLYRDLFGGVEQELNDVDHLLIVPPADLLRLPFHALVTSEDAGFEGEADWLIRRHAISVLPSLTSLRALRSTERKEEEGLGRLLGIGDPIIGTTGPVDCEVVRVADLRSAVGTDTNLMQNDATNGIALAQVDALRALPRLADAECELNAIDALFDQGQSSIYLGDDATEDRIKSLNETGALADYNVLVFATHGLTAGEAGASAPGLVLTPPDVASPENDGLLTAAEIATLTLNARLVVLSACNTAAGEAPDAEGMSGLARAFFHAGGQNLLVTHWSVYSVAAVEISTGLFQELNAQPNQTHASALRRSMLAVVDDPDAGAFRQHPSYWAAFAIVGAN